ncbi:MAG: hypothetical protein IH874_01505, partial [Candidatus Dadabacteria bacterium]|nr:hypothetical protein [Candidatus Dadabacteria bacterium]
MNQNIAFSGIPSLIHDGGDSATVQQWATSIVAGAWDFNDSTNPQAGSGC